MRQASTWPSYAAMRRWHFYAGLFCIPFVMWLSATGSIYLFRPQIEALLDAPYAHVASQARRTSPSEQARAAVAAVPGSILHEYQLPRSSTEAVQIVVGRGTAESRVYVNPSNLRILKVVDEDRRLMPTIFRLHGELLMGNLGSAAVELAASWAIVMILSGLFMWWPRGSRLAGVLWPRLRGHQRWRDLHSVTGFWVSMLALAFLVSGLPWAKSWGAYFNGIRTLAASVTVAPDWAPAGSDALKQRQALDEATRQALDASAKADAGEMSGMAMPGMSMPMMPDARSLARLDYAPLDQVIRSVQPLGLAAPVLVAPPSSIGAPWKASSDAQDRPRQASVTVDGKSGRILSRENFGERPLVDRVINYAIAAHEGQLFGPINQLINLVVASGLMIVSVSGVLLWWRRRPAGVLGAPPHRARPRLASLFVVLVGILGILLPLFAVSLLAVIIVEQLVLRRFESSARWLGLPDRKEKRVIAVLSSVAGSGR